MKLPSDAELVFHLKNLINILEWHFMCFTLTFEIRMKELEKRNIKRSPSLPDSYLETDWFIMTVRIPEITPDQCGI